MSNFTFGNVQGGRDINIESTVGSNVGDGNTIQNNISKITHTIETVQQETDDAEIKATLEELKKSVEKKHEPSIVECVGKLAHSATAVGKILIGTIKSFL